MMLSKRKPSGFNCWASFWCPAVRFRWQERDPFGVFFACLGGWNVLLDKKRCSAKMCRSQTTTWILEEKHCSFKVCFYMSAEHFDIKAQRTSRDRQNNILQQFGMEILQFAFVYPGKCHKHRLNLLPAFTQNAFLHITVVGNLTSFSWRMNGHPTMLETTYL